MNVGVNAELKAGVNVQLNVRLNAAEVNSTVVPAYLMSS